MHNLFVRRIALVLGSLVLAVVAFGGFNQIASTDAAWTDHNTATGSFRSAQILEIGPVLDPECHDETGPPPHLITLTWSKPANLEGHEVVYDVSWRHIGESDYQHRETNALQFSPSLSDLESSQHVVELEFTVQARVKGTDQQGDPVKFFAKGPIGNGILHCMNPNAFS